MSSSLCFIYVLMFTTYEFHRYPVSPLHHWTIQQYLISSLFLLTQHVTKYLFYLINISTGKLSQLIQKYLATDKGLLYHLKKVVKNGNVVEVSAWGATTFPSFKSSRDSPNEVERRGLDQKKKNIMKYIFGNFDLMQWWEFKAKYGFIPYLFKVITNHSKIPLELAGKI